MLTADPRTMLIAVLAFALIALLCRWVFAPSHTTRVRREAGPQDYGLLAVVTRAPSAADAVMLRDHLVAEGVRASVNADHEVLVFRHDLERARTLVG